MVDDLHEHLHNAEFLQYFGPKHYSDIVRSLYVVIHRALHDGGTTIHINNTNITWGTSRKTLGEIPFEDVSKGGKLHRNTMRLILDRDPVASGHISVSQDDGDVFVCHL